MSTAGLRTYFYRVLLPHGKVQTGFLRLLVERDHSARLRLEQQTEGTVLTLKRLPQWLSMLDDLRRIYRAKVGAVDLSKGEAARLNEALENGLTAYTYLSDEPLG